jgi:hypothetical protein
MHMTRFSLLFAGAALLASSAAFGFNPQPDPPGNHRAVTSTPAHTEFNPQPDPPGKHVATAPGCPQATTRDAASGLPSGKRTAGTNGGAAGAGGNPCGFEHPK